MEANVLVRNQFNKQAQNFSNWSITQNLKLYQAWFDFCGLKPGDNLLDTACGTGAFAIFSAKRIREVKGVDISDRMIAIARKHAADNNLENIQFTCHDVENIPFGNNLFSVVVSRSAFHHMKNYTGVFGEMLRCCKEGGRICIEDIVLYENRKLDDFFEELEITIDASHQASLSKRDIFNLYKQNQVKVLRLFESGPKLHFDDYVNHAVQSGTSKQKIHELMGFGLEDKDISRCFVVENEALFWKRKVFTIVGQKIFAS
ncbi:MAG: class I SAM-dependent methyltransferase [Candidatus Aminicenantes bacterium]|nr:MAG: class I SAM-dependent methyltransferase [Candidatus Aminicenantes bacterium]